MEVFQKPQILNRAFGLDSSLKRDFTFWTLKILFKKKRNYLKQFWLLPPYLILTSSELYPQFWLLQGFLKLEGFFDLLNLLMCRIVKGMSSIKIKEAIRASFCSCNLGYLPINLSKFVSHSNWWCFAAASLSFLHSLTFFPKWSF